MASNRLEPLRIAHTARCKLEMAANQPDRNFRFILGHALTLDKAMLRVAEIEFTGGEGGNTRSENDGEQGKERRVGFAEDARAKGTDSQGARRRSPPPPVQQPGGLEVDEDDEDDEDIEDDEDEDSAPLQRFPSASAVPPRDAAHKDDEGIGDMDGIEEGEKVPELSEEQLRRITEGHGNAELVDAYNHIAGCPCHGQKAPAVENVWEISSGLDGQTRGRMAIVQVQA